VSIADIAEFARQLWVVWLMALFLGIAAWAFWPSRRKSLEDAGRIPLRDDEPDARQSRPAGTGKKA
jgi:cytochrome c oxidase cbb3-type subunit 4